MLRNKPKIKDIKQTIAQLEANKPSQLTRYARWLGYSIGAVSSAALSAYCAKAAYEIYKDVVLTCLSKLGYSAFFIGGLSAYLSCELYEREREFSQHHRLRACISNDDDRRAIIEQCQATGIECNDRTDVRALIPALEHYCQTQRQIDARMMTVLCGAGQPGTFFNRLGSEAGTQARQALVHRVLQIADLAAPDSTSEESGHHTRNMQHG